MLTHGATVAIATCSKTGPRVYTLLQCFNIANAVDVTFDSVGYCIFCGNSTTV